MDFNFCSHRKTFPYSRCSFKQHVGQMTQTTPNWLGRMVQSVPYSATDLQNLCLLIQILVSTFYIKIAEAQLVRKQISFVISKQCFKKTVFYSFTVSSYIFFSAVWVVMTMTVLPTEMHITGFVHRNGVGWQLIEYSWPEQLQVSCGCIADQTNHKCRTAGCPTLKLNDGILKLSTCNCKLVYAYGLCNDLMQSVKTMWTGFKKQLKVWVLDLKNCLI